jgi:hypothetical protein
VDCAGHEKAVKMEGADTHCVVELAMLCEDVGDLVGRLPADVARRDVGFGEFGFEEGSEEEQDCSVEVHTEHTLAATENT